MKCSCNVLPIIAHRKLEDQVMQFLHGLNDQYSNVRSHILLMDPLPPISKVFSYVSQQERQFLGANFMINVNVEDKGAMVNVANSPSVCSYCGRIGHTENVCYRKHGFPSNGDNKGSKGSTNHSGKHCTHYGKVGHTVDVCYRKHGIPPSHKFYNGKNASVNNSVTGESNVTENDQQQVHETQDIRFTPQQYQALLTLIQQSSNGASQSSTSHVNQTCSISSCPTQPSPALGNHSSITCSISAQPVASWILDSGATDHVSSSLNHVFSYAPINPIIVKLPTGQHVTATHFGMVKFTESLYLVDVLYIPTFTFNLISIFKLVSFLKCQLIFFFKFMHYTRERQKDDWYS